MKNILGLAGVALALPLYAQPLSFEWDWTLSANSTTHQDSSLLGKASENNSQALDALLDVEVSAFNWTGLIAAKGSQVWASSEQAEYRGELIAQELFWQGSASVFDLPIDFTLGKMRLDWGVGYGYRPLDVFKPYRRNPVGIQVEEGTLTAMSSYFDDQGEWSLVYSDSSYTQQDGSQLEEESEHQGIGLRRYALVGDSEWQALAYYDNVRHGLIGGSIVTLLDSAWAVHSSALYQRRYLSYQQAGIDAPVSLTKEDDGYQVLAGLNWANAVGNNIILEYWYDSRSWSQSQWDSAQKRAETLSKQPAFQGLASSYAQGLNHANLVQHNVMFHWQLDSSAWSHWGWSQQQLWMNKLTPTLDVLFAPQDGGIIATQWLDYQAYDSGDTSINLEMALRFMTGSKDALYANLSDKRMIFLNLKGRF